MKEFAPAPAHVMLANCRSNLSASDSYYGHSCSVHTAEVSYFGDIEMELSREMNADTVLDDLIFGTSQQ